MMMRLIVTGACALFLVGCSAKTETPAPTPGNSGTNAATVDAKATFEIGKDL